MVLGLLVIQVAQATPVMLATDSTYADILVASAAASKIGAELYWVNHETIPEDIYSAIEEAQPDEIYIIGGPAVVSEDIEANLSEKYSVIRIWGMTRYGTAAEVAKYFWTDGAEKAVLARDDLGSEDEYAELVSKAKDIAITQIIPLLLVPEDTLPAETEDALKELGVKEVYIVGDVEDQLKTAIEELNITITGEAKTVEEAESEAVENAEKIIIAAVGEWRDMIPAISVPKGVVILVRNENEIPSVIEKVKSLMQENEIEEIKVVGIPALGQKICDALSKEGISSECITGKRAVIAKKLMKKMKKELEKLREMYKEEMERLKEMLEEKAEDIKEKCETDYEKAKSVIEEINETTELYSVAKARFDLIEALKEECVNAIENNQYRKAYRIAYQLRYEVRMLLWNHRDILDEDVKEEILSEIENKRELVKRISLIKSNIEDFRKVLKTLPPACKEELRTANELINRGEIRRAMEHLRIAKKACEVAKIRKLKELRKAIKEERVCAQVITPAINPETGECKEFPTPCDVPENWEIVRSCKVGERIGIVKAKVVREAKECLELKRELEKAKAEGASIKEIRSLLVEIREKCVKRAREIGRAIREREGIVTEKGGREESVSPMPMPMPEE